MGLGDADVVDGADPWLELVWNVIDEDVAVDLLGLSLETTLKKEIGRRLQDRVMFGCNFPVLRYEKVIADWSSEGYSQQVLEKVLYRNAESYFPNAQA